MENKQHLVELKGNISDFPHDVNVAEFPRPQKRATHLSAYDFTRPPTPGGSYGFGVNREMTASSLRLLADRIERGEILTQRAQVVTEAHGADYTMSVLLLEFAEKDQIDA